MKSYDEIKELLKIGGRDNFWLFCLYYDWDFFQRRKFLKEVALAFQYVADEYKNENSIRIAVSMPPRSGKSYITSLFCAWWLSQFPEQSVMRNTCTGTLYDKFSYDVRDVLRSPKWKAIFPNIFLSKDKQNLDGWNLNTSKQVGYFGAGVGGSIIGLGANIAITDDLYRGLEDALSIVYNEKVVRWKESAHDSRKEKNCPEIYIGTRWTKSDVIGKAISENKINNCINIAALTPERKSFCEDVKTTKEYLEIENDIDETIWMAEYMQEPIDNKGILFSKDDLKFFSTKDLKQEDVSFTFIAVDPADKGGDFYASPVCKLVGNKIFITEVTFNNYGTDTNIPDTIEKAATYKANRIDVEGNSGWVLAGKQIRSQLEERLPYCETRIIKNMTNKETRILEAASWIKNNVYFRDDYKENREYNAFIGNLTAYLKEGANKHDDAPDVLVMVAKFFRNNFGNLW